MAAFSKATLAVWILESVRELRIGDGFAPIQVSDYLAIRRAVRRDVIAQRVRQALCSGSMEPYGIVHVALGLYQLVENGPTIVQARVDLTTRTDTVAPRVGTVSRPSKQSKPRRKSRPRKGRKPCPCGSNHGLQVRRAASRSKTARRERSAVKRGRSRSRKAVGRRAATKAERGTTRMRRGLSVARQARKSHNVKARPRRRKSLSSSDSGSSGGGGGSTDDSNDSDETEDDSESSDVEYAQADASD